MIVTRFMNSPDIPKYRLKPKLIGNWAASSHPVSDSVSTLARPIYRWLLACLGRPEGENTHLLTRLAWPGIMPGHNINSHNAQFSQPNDRHVVIWTYDRLQRMLTSIFRHKLRWKGFSPFTKYRLTDASLQYGRVKWWLSCCCYV
ncbi:uncharacterized protein EURHEDRAFT_66860 [Aspergillus ruber CBS 135680]|uniref:Uncharacterized protein n=1 Tax=Aspergillus ruber (strain CBS 135680) TaxID=1388766 RepID=A0A017SFU6_ASPRC|nr:uncharacterized protein EURHEDRAFT_66860 [Aspergillus ruber CBS 135680]EYE95130.1 hypothetical protein EURHEDRAFT_66860 [Aspergillus ruber CBS 135680]